MPIYPYSFTLPPVNKQDIPSNGVPGEFLGINSGGQLDWLPVSGGSGSGDLLAANNLSELTNFATARTNIGLGTTNTPTFANLTLTSPSLSSSAPVTISQTWAGTGSTVFTALKVNAVSTASSTSSYLLDLQVGGVSQFSIQRNGTLRMPSTDSETKLSYSAAGFLFYGSGAPSLFIGQDGTGNGNAVIGNTGFIGFASAFTAASGNADTRLYRDGAANTLALRNGAAAQTFRVYRSYLNAGVDYERLSFSHDGTQFSIGSERGGSGVAQSLRIYGPSNANLDFANGVSFRNATGSTNFMNISSAGSVGIGTTAPSEKLHVVGSAQFDAASPYINLKSSSGGNYYIQANSTAAGMGGGNYLAYFIPAGKGHAWIESTNTRMIIEPTTGNVGIGTPSPSSKLHVAGNSSPSITVDNTVNTGVSQLLFKNTVVTGDTDGIFLNGSTQTGFGGAGSLNIKATTGPIAFHTATVTNALSIAQSGVVSCTGSFSASGSISAGNIMSLGGSSVTLKDLGSAKLQILNSAQNVGCTLDAATDGYAKFRLRNSTTVFAAVQGKLTTDTDFTATVVTPTGFLTLYDAQGNAYKVPCVPA